MFNKIRFHFLVGLLTILANAATAQSEKALLWKISGPDLKEPSYLFGTYHLLTDKYVATLPEVDFPFQTAKGVVVEMVIDSSKLMALGMMAIMPNNKISNLLTPDEFNRVSSELQTLMGIKLEALDQLKPITVTIMITMLQAQKQNSALLEKFKGQPMDFQFAASGKKLGKTIHPLETQEEQMKLLYDALSVEEQARQLVAYIDQKELAAKSQIDLVNLYLDKDIYGLQKLAESMPKDLGDMDYLLKNRNTKWMEVLPSLMQKGSQFIAVGALHLPGPDGLIELLRQKGYAVTAIP